MKELLSKLPKFDNKTKEELLEILLKEEYGYLPPAPDRVCVSEEKRDISFCAGKADLVNLKFTCYGQWGEFSFPAYYVCPKNAKNPVPAFIHINFRDMIPDRYQPTEELIDAGYATLTFCHNDITQDNWDFTAGFAGLLYPNGERKDDQCGKIGLWAWAAIRLMDYAVTIPEIDKERISVVGHSRLGKTALLAGALDERFYCAISNDSGCSGAALAREKTGETVAGINTNWGYWFCNNYKKYSDNEDKMEFDQHFLLAANYPHKVYVCSAEEDATAHPRNEYLSCVAASEFFEKNGMKGFIHPDRLAETGDVFHQGDIGYHVRSGRHYLSREDWNRYLEFLENKRRIIMSRFIISGFSDEIDQDIEVQFSALNKLGISYFEPRGINGTNIADLTDEQLKDLKKKMEKYGIKASSIGSPIGKIGIRDDFEEHLVKLRRVIHIAKELDVKYIRIFSFFMREDRHEDVRDEVISRMKAMTKIAEEENVILLHENEKGIYGDVAKRCVEILKEVNSPNLRAVFDFANFVQCGQTTYPDAFEIMKPYIEYFHIKDAELKSGDVVPPGEGDGQLETILKAFSEYKGFLSLEPHLGVFEGLADLEEDDKMLGLEKASEKTFAFAHDKLLEILARV